MNWKFHPATSQANYYLIAAPPSAARAHRKVLNICILLNERHRWEQKSTLYVRVLFFKYPPVLRVWKYKIEEKNGKYKNIWIFFFNSKY